MTFGYFGAQCEAENNGVSVETVMLAKEIEQISGQKPSYFGAQCEAKNNGVTLETVMLMKKRQAIRSSHLRSESDERELQHQIELLEAEADTTPIEEVEARNAALSEEIKRVNSRREARASSARPEGTNILIVLFLISWLVSMAMAAPKVWGFGRAPGESLIVTAVAAAAVAIPCFVASCIITNILEQLGLARS